MTSYAKNLVTDYSCPVDGTTDCSTAWLSFTTFLAGLVAGDDVTLTVPSHTYVFKKIGGGAGISMLPGLLGGLTVTVDAPSGATFTDGVGGSGFFLANQIGIVEDDVHSARIVTAAAGATSVTLLTTAQHSRFAVNQWILITGLDLQGYGAPPNPAFYEYRQITAINTGTGVISFTAGLSQQYLSTWPLYYAGDGNNNDLGGPATIYAMPVTWDITATFNRITFSQTGLQYFKGKSATFNDGGVSDSGSGRGICPTQAKSLTFNNFNQANCIVEIDKLVETLVYSGGSANQLDFTSMSGAINLSLTNFALTTLNGTPRNTTISGGSIGSLQIGAHGYGRSDALRCDNCVVSAVSSVAANVTGIVAAGYTITAGTIRWAKSNGPLNWAIPGTTCFFAGTKPNENYVFRVLSVSDDGTDTIVTTTLSAGVPNIPGTVGLKVHPCLAWYGTGNTGCADIVDLSQAGAQGLPLYSYSKRTYTGAWRTSPDFQVWGQLTAVNVNVTTAYTGAQSSQTAEILGQFGGSVLTVDRTATLSYDPIINLKQTGTRSITQGSASGQAGDTLGAAPGAIWFCGAQNVWANHDISGESSGAWPSVSIEIITDQQTGRSVAPMRLRLHA